MENIENVDVKRVRMNVYLVPELKKYVDEQARNFGLSSSAFMTMVIQNYRVQNDALANLNNVNELVERLEKFKSE